MNHKQEIRAGLKELAEKYDGVLTSKIYKARNAILFGYLRNFRQFKTLNIGSRTGLYALRVDPLEYTGFDDTEAFVEAGKKAIKTAGVTESHIYKRRLDDLKIGAERWPFVVALWDALAWAPHEYEIDKVLSEIRTALKPGGRFLIMAPGEDCADPITEEFRNISGENPTGANPATLRAMFVAAGFKIIRIWGIDYKGYKLAKYLPPFLLRLYLALETMIFKGSDRFQWFIVEGFRPMTEEEAKELEELQAKMKQPTARQLAKMRKILNADTVEDQIRRKRLKEQAEKQEPEAAEAQEEAGRVIPMVPKEERQK